MNQQDNVIAESVSQTLEVGSGIDIMDTIITGVGVGGLIIMAAAACVLYIYLHCQIYYYKKKWAKAERDWNARKKKANPDHTYVSFLPYNGRF